MLIGISGLAGAGKDLSADYLVEQFNFVKVPFADPVKRIAQEVYGFTREQLWGPSANRNALDTRYLRARHVRHDWAKDAAAEHWNCTQCSQSAESAGDECLVYLTPRYALQLLGTQWGRQCYENTWVDYAARIASKLIEPSNLHHYDSEKGLHLKKSLPSYRGVAIPDVRFKNEVESLRDKGFKLIRLLRASAGLSGAAGAHASEQEQLSIPDSAFDAVVHNNGPVAGLHHQLSELIRQWR